MFALHWICALTLALVSCLSSQPVKRDDNGIMVHIEDLKEAIKNEENPKCLDGIMLYSPDIKENCMSSAVNCTIEELNVFQNETERKCEELREAIGNLKHAMKETKWNIPDISHPDCTCEMYHETDVTKFADSIKVLVQYLNSKYGQQR